MQLREAYGLFVMEKRVENVSTRTLEFYGWSVGRFVEQVPDASVADVQGLLWGFLDRRRSEVGATSLHSAFRGLRTFCLWLSAESYIPERVKMPKIRKPETVRKGPSLEEVRRAVRHFDTKTFLGIRNSVILRVFFDTGIRLQELHYLDLDHLRLTDGLIFVAHGKGKRQRWVPMGDATRKHLWTYVKQRVRVVEEGEAALFVNRSGTRLGWRGTQSMFKRLAKEMGCAELSPHKLRHGFSSVFLEKGNLFALSDLLGHADIETTKGYAHSVTGQLKAAHSVASPGNRLDT